MKYFKIICAIVCALLSTITYSHDFSAKSNDGQVFFFNITNAKSYTVEITYEGGITSKNLDNYQGEVTIPSKVKYKEQIYSVTAIDDKAFSGADKLTGIIMPSGIESIGSFAFEKCTNLDKIIFSGTNAKMGEGVFFGCTSISNISLGSDWTTLNLKMFMWSNNLKTITIPVKIKSIQNLKSLRYLEEILVDANNSNFSSVDGVLYNKDGRLLLGCPRGYRGDLKIAEGVESIYYAALIDCPYITKIDLPESLKRLSYIEFSRMKELTQVIMRNPELIVTAMVDGERIFALKVANKENFSLIVPRSTYDMLKTSTYSLGGEYSVVADMPTGTPNPSLPVSGSELIDINQIKGVKTFTKYE